MTLRIGNGYDVHAFGEGKFLTLGGVKIPHDKGFVAHSDGDVLIHALCDALLGALSLGDIGLHFPDTDKEFKNLDSRIFLKHVYELIKSKGYVIENCDNTIIAQTPKMSSHILSMRKNIAHDMSVDIEAISIKATTTEKLGFEGRSEGIAVYSVVLLRKKST